MGCSRCGSGPCLGSSFASSARQPSHSVSGNGLFVTDKPTSDPNHMGRRFMSSNVSGAKRTLIYDHTGKIIEEK